MNTVFTSVISLLAKSSEPSKILITTHLNPDGDAIGSALAIANIAQHFGHDVRLFLPENIPTYLSWIPCPFQIEQTLTPSDGWSPHLLFIVDCGDHKRAGTEIADFFTQKAFPTPEWKQVISINIDHHEGNPEFATYNIVFPNWAATGQIIGTLAQKLGIPLAGDLGTYLYLTLVSDTGNFTYSNTNATVLQMAAEIVDNGLKIGDFTNRQENTWTLNRMHLWGTLIQSIRLYFDGKVACCVVTQQILQQYKANKSDLEGLAAWLRKLQGTEAALFIREDAPNRCKVSLRSSGKVDVRLIANQFGGGGHAMAAGCELNSTPEKTATLVLNALQKVVQTGS